MELDLNARIHVVALPHTHLTRDYDYCAYTAKIRRFTHMLTSIGHEPTVYGPIEQDVAEGTDYEPIVYPEDRLRWFGTENWDRSKVFDVWDAAAPCWQEMNTRAADRVFANWQAGDILGLIAGACQQQVVDQLRERGINPLVWEWGVGYSGVLDGSHKTFESHAWAHHVAGLRRHDDISFFDSVVPNCFDPNDFLPSRNEGQYLLFMGRPTPRKGLPIIAEIAKHTNVPIKIAGQPGADLPGTEYVGLVTGQEKAELLAGALALLAPTTYLEPFGGVVIEAAMSGTPAITTDWGAFTETVQDRVTGFRCRTLAEFLHAVRNAHTLDRRDVLHHSDRYTLTEGAWQYSRVIHRLQTLHHGGWYELPEYLQERVGSQP